MKKKLLALIFTFSMAFSFVGCSASMPSGNEAAPDISYGEGFAGENAAQDNTVIKDETASGENYSQKLIKKYNMTFETTEYDKSFSFVKRSVEDNQGYIENLQTYGSTSYRSSSFVIRVPEAQAQAFLNSVGEIGELVSQSESAKDVTLEYYDTASKIESLKVQRERLLELLEQAETLSDIITIEDKLEEVESEINEYGTRLKVYDNLVNYVTVNIEIREVETISIVEEDSFLTQIKKGFLSNLNGVISVMKGLVFFLISWIPTFILIGIIVVIIVCVIKKRRKHNRKEDV